MSHELTQSADVNAEAECMQYNCWSIDLHWVIQPVSQLVCLSVSLLPVFCRSTTATAVPMLGWVVGSQFGEGCNSFDKHSKCHQMVC